MSECKKSDCSGCKNNFYNGNNSLGVSECWSFAEATMVKALDIHIDVPPPYKQKPTSRPSCYKANRYIRVKPENLTAEGYWK